MKHVLLTFDLEECDIIRDYCSIDKEQEFQITKQGLLRLLKLLDKYNLKTTFFTTSNFAKKFPDLTKKISEKGHEIACHGLSHDDCYLSENDFKNIVIAKNEIELITGEKVLGFRAPRFEIKKIHKLQEFTYDSSIHPTFIPGKYQNLSAKTKIHNIGELIEIPPSTLPLIRLPIFWIAFKNLPQLYAKTFTKLNFLFSDYTMIILHPWEFADISNFNLPKIVSKKSGFSLINLLERYILFCKKNKYSFNTIKNYLFSRNLLNAQKLP